MVRTRRTTLSKQLRDCNNFFVTKKLLHKDLIETFILDRKTVRKILEDEGNNTFSPCGREL